MKVCVQAQDFDAGAEMRALSRDPRVGAVASFIGVVREVAMTLEHYPGAIDVLAFLVKSEVLSNELRVRMLAWRHGGFSAHNEVSVVAEDAEGRKKLAGYMLRAPMSL